ncbi:Small-conductance mechanosensitive channel [bioreactor metagenome]|uniref:Small-conductance mechanosensitive channel n=1 Tax=bioreactor metagenome TaxID=1076179 RepID=A0A645CS59_9ZZZZ
MNTEELTQNVSDAVNTISEQSTQALAKTAITAVLLLVVCVVAMRVIMKVADRLIDRLNVEKSLHTFLRSMIRIVLWFLTILIVAGSLGIDATSLIAILSVAGLAVSLAIQGTLSNLAGGIMLLTSKPFKVGEFIEAGGVSGTVMDIGLVYTRISTADNKIIFVPNSDISGAKIINYSTEGRRRVDLPVSASYDAPVDKVKQSILKVIGAHPKTLYTPEPQVRVNAYGDSSIEYTVRVWCDTKDYWEVYYDLLEQIKKAVDQDGIEMTYNHLNVHILDNPSKKS